MRDSRKSTRLCWNVYLMAGVIELSSVMTPMRHSIGTHRPMRASARSWAGRSDRCHRYSPIMFKVMSR